jgi:hypothetical protein
LDYLGRAPRLKIEGLRSKYLFFILQSTIGDLKSSQ